MNFWLGLLFLFLFLENAARSFIEGFVEFWWSFKNCMFGPLNSILNYWSIIPTFSFVLCRIRLTNLVFLSPFELEAKQGYIMYWSRSWVSVFPALWTSLQQHAPLRQIPMFFHQFFFFFDKWEGVLLIKESQSYRLWLTKMKYKAWS